MTRTWSKALLARVALAALVLTSLGTAAAGDPPATLSVVVTAADAETAAALVVDRGGAVERELPLVGGVAATMGADAAEKLSARAGVDVVPDAPVTFTSTDLGPPPAGDLQLQGLNPPEHWSSDTGSGVGVALIDTGVAEVSALAGRVIHGANYTDEPDGDGYGHGTFMAGLIAADGTATTAGEPIYGTAPAAHIVSVKVAGADGATNLSTLLDAIGWVVVNQDEHNIRVLNLSVAVTLPMAPAADPLAAAVQAAWASGITVVTAAGNDGIDGVASPGHDPFVITVGSTDPNGTSTLGDDSLAEWSSRGRIMGNHKPDVLAPGVSTVSLRVPGSHIDEGFPEARVGDAHFRGSGTSMSTALVSGAVAGLAEFRPFATPDDFKAALVTSGYPIDGSTAPAVDLAAADLAEPMSDWRQDHNVTTRGPDGRPMRAMPWNERGAALPNDTWVRARWVDDGWVRARWVEDEWARARWVEERWTRARWVESGWVRARWVEDEWARARWVEDGWARARWVDANFARARWVDEQWARARWVESDWTRARWVDSQWTRARWVDEEWARARWVGTSWTAATWEQRDTP